MRKFTQKIQQDNEGNLYFELEEQVLEELGWTWGDNLKWEPIDDTKTSWKLSKIDDIQKEKDSS